MQNRIAATRLARGLRQQDVADALRIHQSQISRFESADIGDVSLGHIVAIADYFDCPINQLFEREDD